MGRRKKLHFALLIGSILLPSLNTWATPTCDKVEKNVREKIKELTGPLQNTSPFSTHKPPSYLSLQNNYQKELLRIQTWEHLRFLKDQFYHLLKSYYAVNPEHVDKKLKIVNDALELAEPSSHFTRSEPSELEDTEEDSHTHPAVEQDLLDDETLKSMEKIDGLKKENILPLKRKLEELKANCRGQKTMAVCKNLKKEIQDLENELRLTLPHESFYAGDPQKQQIVRNLEHLFSTARIFGTEVAQGENFTTSLQKRIFFLGQSGSKKKKNSLLKLQEDMKEGVENFKQANSDIREWQQTFVTDQVDKERWLKFLAVDSTPNFCHHFFLSPTSQQLDDCLEQLSKDPVEKNKYRSLLQSFKAQNSGPTGEILTYFQSQLAGSMDILGSDPLLSSIPACQTSLKGKGDALLAAIENCFQELQSMRAVPARTAMNNALSQLGNHVDSREFQNKKEELIQYLNQEEVKTCLQKDDGLKQLISDTFSTECDEDRDPGLDTLKSLSQDFKNITDAASLGPSSRDDEDDRRRRRRSDDDRRRRNIVVPSGPATPPPPQDLHKSEPTPAPAHNPQLSAGGGGGGWGWGYALGGIFGAQAGMYTLNQTLSTFWQTNYYIQSVRSYIVTSAMFSGLSASFPMSGGGYAFGF